MANVKVLIAGGGAREHAIAWKLKQDRPELELLLAPGNDGSAVLGRRVPLAADDVEGLVRLARAEQVELTVIGPEGPLAAGVADRFAAEGLPCFGPTRAAAEIEWSKGWAKEFMRRHGIPTAHSASFELLADAEEYVRRQALPPVIKDDALAGGKGVTVAASQEQALQALRVIFENRRAARVVIEERMDGWEVSAHVLCDGRVGRLMPFSCDYKRIGDGDTGANTGGMGAYAPAGVSEDLAERIRREIVDPAVAGLAAEGRPFVGLLYPGVMITPDGPKVVEFNARFGDPETEVLLPLLESDLLEVLLACTRGELAAADLRWRQAFCCGVVLASPGYPEQPQPGQIAGLEKLRDALLFRAGSSGRMLTLSALGSSLQEARERSYAALARLSAPGAQFRRDIALVDRASEGIPVRR